ncbi:hypothetical protein E2P81_ATG08089 [Venturia nashicola]|nr:hypothetical protein E2P81_ATG08089 [Venturia nashicola]
MSNETGYLINPAVGSFREKPKWEAKADKFLASIPQPSEWAGAIAKCSSAASVSNANASNMVVLYCANLPRKRTMLGRMEEYIKDVGKSDILRKAKQLVFLAVCAVIRSISGHSRQQINEIVRVLYLSIAARTCEARYQGIKWIGAMCTELFPIWGPNCHDIFLLFGVDAKDYTQLRSSQANSIRLLKQHLAIPDWQGMTNTEHWSYFCLPCVVWQLVGPLLKVNLDDVCNVLEYRGAVAEHAKLYQTTITSIAAAKASYIMAEWGMSNELS